jgi:hypothetical protein
MIGATPHLLSFGALQPVIHPEPAYSLEEARRSRAKSVEPRLSLCASPLPRLPTCLRRDSLRIKRMSRSIGSDVLVNAKKVIGIVFPLDGHQSIIIVSVGRSDPINAFFHHEVHVRAAEAVRMEG